MGEVTDYIATLDEPARSVIDGIRSRVVELVPEATEGRSYAMPAILYRGKPLIAVIQTKKHLAIYPFSGEVVSRVASRLDGYSLSSGTIRFAADQPLPEGVLENIVDLRRTAIDASLDG